MTNNLQIYQKLMYYIDEMDIPEAIYLKQLNDSFVAPNVGSKRSRDNDDNDDEFFTDIIRSWGKRNLISTFSSLTSKHLEKTLKENPDEKIIEYLALFNQNMKLAEQLYDNDRASLYFILSEVLTRLMIDVSSSLMVYNLFLFSNAKKT